MKAAEIQTAIEKLPAKTRACFDLMVKGVDKEDIKKQLGMSPLTYSSMCSRLIKVGIVKDGEVASVPVAVKKVAFKLLDEGEAGSEEESVGKKDKKNKKKGKKSEPVVEPEVTEETETETEPEEKPETEKPKKELKLTKAVLEAAAADLNDLLDPEPAVEAKKGSILTYIKYKDEKGNGVFTKKDKKLLNAGTVQVLEFIAEKEGVRELLPWCKTATTKKNKSKTPYDPTKSNKAQVYLLWDNGKGIDDLKKLHKKVKGAVKETTIRNWIAQWKKGNNLPAVATR